jgi:hypothetical protein
MENIKNWCSNKENIKILIMIGMAIILLIILKIRFGAKADHTPDASAARYETGTESLTRDSVREYIKRIPEKPPARSEKVMSHGLKPPPFLKRDIFFSRTTGTELTRKAEHVDEVKLELTATIIDGQGALAIIGNEVLGMGEVVKGLRVTSIKNNEVTLTRGKRQYVLRIKEE